MSAVSHAEDRLECSASRGTGSSPIGNGTADAGAGLRYGDNIPAGDVSAVVRKPHRLDVFVMGADKTLRQWPDGGLENAKRSHG